MSRIQENEELLNRAQLSFTGAPEKVMCNIEAQKLGILMDISKSLAVMADGLNSDPFSKCLVAYEESDDGN